MNDSNVLHRSVDILHLPVDAVNLAATADERARLAVAYDLVEVKGLAAEATFKPGARGSFTVEGRVIADIVQTCVVSLVPVDQHIDETFTVRFVRPQDAPPGPRPGAEVALDPDDPEPPEVLRGPSIDLGAVAEEAFVLAIDPYPRAPGAVLQVEASGAADEAAPSPFSVLDRLRGGSRKDS